MRPRDASAPQVNGPRGRKRTGSASIRMRLRPFTYVKGVRAFLVTVSIVVTVFVTAISLLRYVAIDRLLVRSTKQEAESFARLIVLVRHWNAQYGGVYVEKRPGVVSNPYLRELGVEPDIRTRDGKVLTLRNPAIMTREISELAARENILRFHMISLKNLNPDNRPDAFERSALERFERGEDAVWKLDEENGKPVFRYVLPIVTEAPCLQCHGKQGYTLGSIRGGISVMTPADGLLAQMRTSRDHIIIDGIATAGILLTIIFFLGWKLALRLDEAQKRLRHMAITDELTGLKNRRYIMERLDKEYQRAVRTESPLSLIVFDIDHFKKVNDTYGHVFGDLVLKEAAREMLRSLRSYDLLGRIGGEEFLIAAPGSTLDEAAGLAERIRETIGSRRISDGAHGISVTVSAGVTSLSEQDARADRLLARADAALYMAKQEGRDRVVAL
jgi:diguanylate cyclase (GGDEF)-like protein